MSEMRGFFSFEHLGPVSTKEKETEREKERERWNERRKEPAAKSWHSVRRWKAGPVALTHLYRCMLSYLLDEQA